MRKLADKSYREIHNIHLSSITFFRKSYLLWDIVKKKVALVTGHRSQYITVHALCMPDWHSEYILLKAFYGKSSYANASQCSVTRTLPLLTHW